MIRPRTAGEPLGIVAGGGELPKIVARSAAASGWRPRVVMVGDGLDHDWSDFGGRGFSWGRAGDAIAYMASEGVRRLVFCGTISVRPDFRSILPSLATLAILPEVLRVVRGGDDTLLRAVAKAFERRGFEFVAVHDIVPELLMPEGPLTGRLPGPSEVAALDRGFEAAILLGRLDVGQAAVASAERIIALEAIEGTREMLQRVADLKRRGKIGKAEACVLVKSVKPRQDLRFDLPSIGAATIEEAAAAGLCGIGLSAGRALVIGFDEIVAAARRHRMFLFGRPSQPERDEGNRA